MMSKYRADPPSYGTQDSTDRVTSFSRRRKQKRWGGQPFSTLDVLKASVAFVAVGAAAFILWTVRDGVLLLLAAVIAAILLRVFADAISRWTRLPGRLSLAAATLIIALVALLSAWLFGTHIVSEFSDVIRRATAAWNEINQRLQNTQLAGLGHRIEQTSTPMVGSSVRQGFSALTEAIEALVVLVVSAIYLAAEPRIYRIGVIRLFKPELQVWAGESIDILGQTMKSWLYGQLFTMLLVGVLSCVADWIIGVPGPLALGLIAFLTEAIPYLGPFLGGIPAVLVASTKGLETSVITAGAYLIIHLIEGYLCSPLIQRYFVSMPPALMLFGITFSELLFGTPGLLVAAPLTVTIFVTVRMFYLRDTLNEKTDLPQPEGFGREEGIVAAGQSEGRG